MKNDLYSSGSYFLIGTRRRKNVCKETTLNTAKTRLSTNNIPIEKSEIHFVTKTHFPISLYNNEIFLHNSK